MRFLRLDLPNVDEAPNISILDLVMEMRLSAMGHVLPSTLQILWTGLTVNT